MTISAIGELTLELNDKAVVLGVMDYEMHEGIAVLPQQARAYQCALRCRRELEVDH